MLSYDHSNEDPSAMAKRVSTTHLSPTSVDEMRRYIVKAQRRHRVTFSSAATFEFPVAFGTSALPKETGPALGMAQTHSKMYMTDISRDTDPKHGRVIYFTHLERVTLLKAAHVDVHEIAAYCDEAIEIRQSREREANAFHLERLEKRRIRQAATILLDLVSASDDEEPARKRRRVVDSTV
ncbi:unnamed protein product [Aphanomyces euteiches]